MRLILLLFAVLVGGNSAPKESAYEEFPLDPSTWNLETKTNSPINSDGYMVDNEEITSSSSVFSYETKGNQQNDFHEKHLVTLPDLTLTNDDISGELQNVDETSDSYPSETWKPGGNPFRPEYQQYTMVSEVEANITSNLGTLASQKPNELNPLSLSDKSFQNGNKNSSDLDTMPSEVDKLSPEQNQTLPDSDNSSIWETSESLGLPWEPPHPGTLPGPPPGLSTDSRTWRGQWSDHRSRNRNRPVIKPPEPSGDNSRNFGGMRSPAEVKRLEMLREQLIRQLHLEGTAEEVPPLPPLPDNLDLLDTAVGDMGELMGDDEDSAKTTQVIVFADDVTSLCDYRRSTGCYYFDLHDRLSGTVTRASLWVFKQRDPNDIYRQSVVVSELETTGGRHGDGSSGKLHARNIVGREVIDVRTGWLKFDVTRTVQRWEGKPHKNEGVAIRCKSCSRRNHRVLWGQKDGFRPLLVIQLRPDSLRRHRRSAECGPGEATCCKHPLYVTFEELDLPSIVRPTGVMVNYCAGSCDAVYQGHHRHTMLMQQLRASTDNATVQRMLTPCCAPTKLVTVSIFHYDDGALKTSHVPNLAVSSCGCL